jgi:hypothetical protein
MIADDVFGRALRPDSAMHGSPSSVAIAALVFIGCVRAFQTGTV